MIYVTALENGSELITYDAHFKDLPHVDYTPKAI